MGLNSSQHFWRYVRSGVSYCLTRCDTRVPSWVNGLLNIASLIRIHSNDSIKSITNIVDFFSYDCLLFTYPSLPSHLERWKLCVQPPDQPDPKAGQGSNNTDVSLGRPQSFSLGEEKPALDGSSFLLGDAVISKQNKLTIIIVHYVVQ